VASAFTFVFRVEPEVHQSIVAFARFHDNVATTTAVTAGRPAARHELLPTKCHTPIAAVTGLDPDNCLIYEHLGENPSVLIVQSTGLA
jgi:hypothetical protein